MGNRAPAATTGLPADEKSGAMTETAPEPMTGAQAASLKRLAEEIREPHAFDAGLSRSEAARRIDRLQERVRLGELPPHTD